MKQTSFTWNTFLDIPIWFIIWFIIWFPSWIVLIVSFSIIWWFQWIEIKEFKKYCENIEWQYLEYNKFCYIDWNYFEYISEIEKYIFEKKLSSKK